MSILANLLASAEALKERILSNNAVHAELTAFVDETHKALAALEQKARDELAALVERVVALEGAGVKAAAELLPGLPLVPNAQAQQPTADNAGANGAQS